jgi:hypothetical protein
MEQYFEEQNLIQRYLLGVLDSETRQRLEERLLTDNEFFEELLVAEDELIDSYLSSSLSPGDKEKFEGYFLSTPERRQKISFAKTLRKYIVAKEEELTVSPGIDNSSPSRKRFLLPHFGISNPLIGLSVAATLLLIAIGVGWLIMREQRSESPSGRRDSGHVLAITLTAGATRSEGEINSVNIPAKTTIVEFRLELPADEYENYRAVIQTDNGSEIFSLDQLKAEKSGTERVVIVQTPAQTLHAGDFQLKLSGLTADGKLEDVSGYYFRILK